MPDGHNSAVPVGVVRSYLFADLRDYTVFVETQGNSATVRLLRAYRTLVRAEVAAHRGAEIKTEGDSFYVVFRTPGAAIRCALGIVERAARHDRRHPDLALRIGIGINSGEAVELGGGYVGSAVIVAARLAQQAEGGRILVTDTVRALMSTGAIAPMRDLGRWKLKGITQSVHVYAVETGIATAARTLGPSVRIPPMLLPPPLRGATGLLVCPELVGRESAIAALDGHLAAAAAGEGRVVALTGEAGVGKSRLVRELARRAHEGGFYVFGGRSHRSAATPYEPFIAALRPFVEARGAEILRQLLGSLIGELRRLLPELDLGTPPDDAVMDDNERRDRFFRTIQLLLEDAVALRPVLLVLEDLHEADAATRDLLADLAGTLRGGYCIVFTYRSEDVGPTHPLRRLAADLDRERRLARLEVAALDGDGVRRMTRALLGERGTEALAQEVFTRSEGVPFYVEELLKTALDDPEAGVAGLSLPRTVRDSVQIRVARLADERGQGVAGLLEAAAIAGVPLGYEMLLAISGRPEEETADDISACLDAQLLERPPTRDEIYQFRHAITRDAIESAISVSRRRRLHRQVGEALEKVGLTSPRAGALARHFTAAGDVNKAVHYAREAARAAIVVGAYTAAIEHLGEAAGQAAGAPEEAAVQEELGAALQAAGRAPEAEQALVRALGLVSAPLDTARIDVRLGAVLRIQGRRAEAIAAVERAIDLIPSEAGEPLADAMATWADLAWAENDAEAAFARASSALTAARAAGAERIVVRAMTVRGAVLARRGDAAGIPQLREAVIRASGRDLGTELVDAYLELERAERAIGHWEAAAIAAEAGLVIARLRGNEFAQARLLAQLAATYVTLGRYADARAVAEQAVALSRPGTIAGTYAMTMLAAVLTRQGEPAAALALCDQIAPEMERAEPEQRANYFGERAGALLGVGRPAEALGTVKKGIALHCSGTGAGLTTFTAALDVAEAVRDAGEVTALIESFDAQFAGRDTPTIRVVRGEMGAVQDALRGQDAAAAFEQVAADYAALGVRVRAAYRRASAALALRASGLDALRARRMLAAARRELGEMGAGRYLNVVAAAPATPQGRPTPSSPVPGPLGPAELRVAALISSGYTDARIAARLRVSQPHVTRLVGRVKRALGVTTRAQVASWASQRGIAGAPSPLPRG